MSLLDSWLESRPKTAAQARRFIRYRIALTIFFVLASVALPLVAAVWAEDVSWLERMLPWSAILVALAVSQLAWALSHRADYARLTSLKA